MKIALISPARSPLATSTQALAAALRRSKLEVEAIEIDPEPARAALALAELFERARRFDVVHVRGETRAFGYALLADVALVITLPAALDVASKALLERLRPRAAIAAESRERVDGSAEHVLEPAGDDDRSVDALAKSYETIYADRLGHDERSRVDHHHDRRPWGEYWVLSDHEAFKVKRIDVLPRKRLSYQRHARRAEHWIVVRGKARVTLDGRDVVLERGDTIDIAIGAAHRIENLGDDVLTFVEIQTGTYFGEDDIVRLDDDFGRA